MIRKDVESLVKKRFMLQRIKQAIDLAEIQALTNSQFLKRLTNLLEDPQREILIQCVHGRKFSQAEHHQLSKVVKTLSARSESLPSKLKTNADRALYRLSILSPQNVAVNMAFLFLDSKRKLRREIGLRILHKVGLTPEGSKQMIKRFKQGKQQIFLELIARNPQVVPKLNINYILIYLKDFYWRMRIFEALIIFDGDTAVKYCEQYPKELTHAVGRCKEGSLLGKLRKLIDKNQDDLEHISVYAWALMRIGAWEDLTGC